ncbi:coat protein [Ilarvirus ApMV]|uniref:Coat protein n=1 Tax=Ilarvirus ApMV TaxID=12319 RepID=Q65004_9BROM|nr:coat protein [Apple mosaic virus]AAA86961.1 coat protein [Apple mosaic virus]AAN52087.1 coat protein [Apple mosaic virus]CCC54908.1 coat protein [Apple mosaic virus]
MVCKYCNHTHPGSCAGCKWCHSTNRFAPPKRAVARQANPNKGKIPVSVSRAGRSIRRGGQLGRLGARMLSRKFLKGHRVLSSREVTATVEGRFVNIDFADVFRDLLEKDLKVYTFIIRVNSLSSNGWIGLVEDYDESNPKGPNPMDRKGFKKDQPRGGMWEAPPNTTFDDFVRKFRLVLEFKTNFAAGAKVFMRDLYVITSELPPVQIPTNVLLIDEDLLEL